MEVVLRQHANGSCVKAMRKPSRLKKLGNGKRISAVSKEARPKRTEGKRHRNQNGQRKIGIRTYK
jgi:hypothetical protein